MSLSVWKRSKTQGKGNKINFWEFSAIEVLTLDFEDIRTSNEEFNKLQMMDYTLTFLALLSIAFSIMAVEFNYYYSESPNVIN